MGVLVTGSPAERSDLAQGPFRTVARGLLDMTAGAGAGAWIGAHPGFADAITNTGVGLKSVFLAAAGAATMYGRATIATTHHIAHATALVGATLQELPVLGQTDAGAAAEVVCFVEVLETAV